MHWFGVVQVHRTSSNLLELHHYRESKVCRVLLYKKVLCQSSDDLLDVFCGKEYRTHTFLMSPDNLSFTLNTDGVAVFRSSKNSLWPVWLVINELPPAERYMYIHVITL